MDMCLLKFDISQGAIAPNCFKSHITLDEISSNLPKVTKKIPFLTFFILLGKYSSLGFSCTVINYSGWTAPWKVYLIWVVQISSFAAHGNEQR